jgi:hypothetical protein
MEQCMSPDELLASWNDLISDWQQCLVRGTDPWQWMERQGYSRLLVETGDPVLKEQEAYRKPIYAAAKRVIKNLDALASATIDLLVGNGEDPTAMILLKKRRDLSQWLALEIQLERLKAILPATPPVTPPLAAILRAFLEADPVSMTVPDLARQLDRSDKHTGRLVALLEERSLISPPNGRNGRQLTATGRQLARKLPADAR